LTLHGTPGSHGAAAARIAEEGSNPEQGFATRLSLAGVRVFVLAWKPKRGPATKIAVEQMASGQNGEAFHPAQAPVAMVLEQKQRHGIASMRTPTAKELLVQEHPHMKRIAITEKSRNATRR
jgi:hypothetical protein